MMNDATKVLTGADTHVQYGSVAFPIVIGPFSMGRHFHRKGFALFSNLRPDSASIPESLGNLASSARQSHTKGTRWIFLFIGLISAGVGGFLLFNAPKEVDDLFNKEIEAAGPGAVIDQELMEAEKSRILRFVQVIYGIQIMVGVAFVCFAALVTKYPVPITISGLILYIASMAITAFFDPSQLVRGIVIKIIIVVSLIRSISAAMAERNETPKDPLVQS
jgi:hypothetical protein